jgi:broad specificity phosphatase PhoE
MLDAAASTSSQTPFDREGRVQALLGALRSQAEPKLRQMAERLVDLPEDKAFGQIEYDLGDLGRAIATCAHQAGLAGKKGGT